MFKGISTSILIFVALPVALVDARPRHPVIVSKIFGFPNKLFYHSFIKKDLPKGYEDFTAKEKQDILWELCSKNETSASNGNPLALFPRNMNDVFDHVSDERPWRGDKPIHISGPVCKAKFDANPGTPYTGLFKGCKTLFLRLSPGTSPQSSGSTLTGLGAKFLIDGKPSANLCVFRRKGDVFRSNEDIDNPDCGCVGLMMGISPLLLNLFKDPLGN